MSKTERALESEALDRDDVVADGHTDGVERPSGSGSLAHHDEATDTWTAEEREDLADSGPAEGAAVAADDIGDDGDGVAVFDAEADEPDWPIAPTEEARRPAVDTEPVVVAEDMRRDDAESAVDASDQAPTVRSAGPVPGEALIGGAGAGWTAPSPPDGDTPADESGSWDPTTEAAADRPATSHADTGATGHGSPDGDDEGAQGFVGPEPSEDVLEELRRADVDGPTVIMAPQDDTTAARRRPRRLPEYDPAPIPVPTKIPRVLGRKPRVRKVTRVVRSVDPWSVFKIAMIASLVLYVIVLTSGVLLWNVAYATGTIDNVERFFESFGWSSFEFNGGEIFHAAWIGGLFAAIGLTGLAVLAAALFNLITDLVGGVRLTVLEEEVVETRISPMRRFVVRRSAPPVPAVETDESGPLIRETIVDDSGAIIRRTR